MHNLRPAIVAILLGASCLAAAPISASAQTCTCAATGIRAEEAPPPLPEYDQPPMPASGYLWTPGYWSWNNEDYYWVPGTWVEPPRPGVLWTPGYWAFADGVYVFNRGYWGPHVGFYGGVDYGFGYGGSGYQGGRWDNGAFFYNRSVNNIGAVHITNVYNETVVVNKESAGRASFNGGAGGTLAKPTAEEEIAAKEPHEKPTNLQVEHRRKASVNADSFAATNHGKPPVAATSRPGALTGPHVVKARAAGAAETAAPAGGEKRKDAVAPGKEPQTAPEKSDLRNEPKTDSKPMLDKNPGEKTPALKEQREPKEQKELKEQKEPRELKEKMPAPRERDEKTAPVTEAPKAAAEPKRAPEPAHAAPHENRPPMAHPAPQRPGPGKPQCGHPGEPACH